MSVRWLIFTLLVALSACQLRLDGAACPCASGWTCCADRNVCVPEGAACAPDGGGDTDGSDAGVDPDLLRLDLVHARSGDHFGAAVASSGDLVAISAPERDSAAPDAGAVELYQRRGSGTGVWIRVVELVAPDPQ